jgi:hypothetical protein
MGDDPDLYRTFVQMDPPWIPYGIPRDPSRDVGWCTSTPRWLSYVTNKIHKEMSSQGFYYSDSY